LIGNLLEQRAFCKVSAGLIVALALAALPVPAAIRPVRAEHEVPYRYTVLGYVRDAAGRPRAGLSIEVAREKTGLAYRAVTDGDGFYVVIMRLGDQSAGETLRLRVGGAVVSILARFDPADRARERGTQVDVAGERIVERPPAFAETLRRFLAR
jgi:hypothetical protein